MKRLKQKLLITFSFISFLAGYAQQAEIKFQQILSKHGLSQSSVYAIIKDSKGFMWFGTQDGLNKYNGYQMEVYKHIPDDSTSLSDNYIQSLIEDNSGNIWVGTNGGGIDILNPQTLAITHLVAGDKSLSNNNINTLFKDKDGNIWAGTLRGLNHIDAKTKKITRFNVQVDSICNMDEINIRAIKQTDDGELCIGTHGYGLVRYKSNKFLRIDIKSLNNSVENVAAKSNTIRVIYFDKQNNLWLGSDGGGLILFDTKTNTIKSNIYNTGADVKGEISGNRIYSITEDDAGNLWCATWGNGISILDKKTKQFNILKYNATLQTSIRSNIVLNVYKDNLGNIWAGTYDAGVCPYFPAASKFQHFIPANFFNFGFLNNSITSIIEDNEGVIWFSSVSSGITSCNIHTGEIANYQDIIYRGTTTAMAIYQDVDSIIWVGAYGSGLSNFNKRTGDIQYFVDDGASRYTPDNSPIKNGTILCITGDKKGRIWIATLGAGVYVYDKKTKNFTNYTTKNGLTSDYIFTLKVDKNDNVWVGTQNGGASYMDGNTGKVLKTYQQARKDATGYNFLSSNKVNHFYIDRDENIWIATSIGLNKIDAKTGKLKYYYEKDGLPNDYVYCVLPDNDGNLWMTTNKGVAKLNPNLENIDGSAFRNYDKNDGLQDDEFSQGAFYVNPTNGTIFIGGLNGFNTFNSSTISNNKNIPPIYITAFKRFGKDVPLDTNIISKKFIELSYKDNFFSFEFVSLDYVFPEKNKFMYKMEGLDADWSAPGTSRIASYTNLSGGDYVFRVKGCNNDGTWNEEGVAIHIRVIPPFWKTNAFYIICALLIAGSVFGYTRWRTASIEKEKKVLEQKVAERTEELAEKNRDITSSIQYAERIQLAILPPVSEIKQNLKQCFVLYKPKDIVSGDFYWYGQKNGKEIIAAVDCTGHGVPGAFMSMIGSNLLSAIIMEKGITKPSEILNLLHNGVQSALKQGSNEIETSDGMDLALCTIDLSTNSLEYAGAYRSLVIVRNGKIIKIDSTKFPIGGKQMDTERNFTNNNVQLSKGDTVYMFSDGYADQFGGEKGKKFMVKRMDQLLLEIQTKTMDEQGAILDKTIETWKGNHQQVDDILVIGIRF
jgi:ligand-binding sensor domain-containing protein/serine phosphatase RsbU (regulator of sigma subunit)